MITYNADTFGGYCYYFLIAPGGMSVRVEGKNAVIHFFIFTALAISVIGFIIPICLGRSYYKGNKDDVDRQIAKKFTGSEDYGRLH